MARRRGSLPELSKNLIFRLLKEYKENCCLWKATHTDYRNNKVKIEAWNKLLKIYQEENPNATRASIRNKIHQIRQKYVLLRRRTLVEPTFEPKLWYYRHLNFLASQVGIRTKKNVESAGDDSNEDEETKFEKALTNLLNFLPYEERPSARNFIAEITKRAKMRHMGVLKLSMRVGDNDVILISNREPICSMSTPFFSGVTPEELERQDITETENAVNFLRFYSNEPNDNFNPAVIVIDDDN